MNVFCASILFLALACGPAWSQSCVRTEADKLLASDGVVDDGFGYSVSMSGNRVVVGAEGADDSGPDAGSAYVYEVNGTAWLEKQKLLASDGASGDHFGQAVSVHENVVVVGAYEDGDNGVSSGSAYVFRFEGTAWAEQQKLTASDGFIQDLYGESVSVSGDVIVVGAKNASDIGLDEGAAYVYRFDGTAWAEEQKLQASDGLSFDIFGGSVSVSGDVIVVGARGDDGPMDKGAAYVFRYNGTTWVEEQKLRASDAVAFDYFGYAVSVDEDVALIGAVGKAYLYRWDGTRWREEQKLQAIGGSISGGFGFSVAVQGPVAVVGDPFEDANGTDSGSAYLYRFDGSNWVGERKFLASDGTTDDHLGYVSVSGDRAVAGAPSDDDNGQDSGAFYVFDVSGPPVLDISPQTVALGETVSITTCGGQPSSLSMLALVAINGTPFFRSIAMLPFSSEGCWALSGRYDEPTLAGNALSLQTFHVDDCGLLAESEAVVVEFQ
jgi:hypothetical protein